MPSKKKKYNARFPAGRIKKIMQTDEEVGKVAQAVPVIISRTLELFVESLLTKTMQITSAKNAKTLSPSHMKQCILSESRFDFLKDLVKSLPDSSACDEDNSTATGGITSLSPMTPPAASASAVPLLPSAEDVKYPPSTHGLPPYLQHGVPNRDVMGDTESKSRLHPMMSPVSSGLCPPGGVGGSGYQVPVNPNFYMESSPAVHHHQSPYNRDIDGSDYHHNHFNSNSPSVIMSAPTQPQPLLVQPLKNERSSTPPVLVVDEDYDT